MTEQWEPGCYVDGHWGRYGIHRLFDIATTAGMDHDSDDDAIASEYEKMDGSDMLTLSTGERIDVFECMVDLANKAETWLNDNVAEAGMSFGWHDGEFMYWSTETWQEE